jgi:membrane associated rhomboid family serine protease
MTMAGLIVLGMCSSATGERIARSASAEYGGGVAFFAHIGGFVVGLVITFIIRGSYHSPRLSSGST